MAPFSGASNERDKRLFAKVADLERRLSEVEQRRRDRKPRAAAARSEAHKQLAARDKALAKRREQREREEMRVMKVELISGGSGLPSRVSSMQGYLRGDDWRKD